MGSSTIIISLAAPRTAVVGYPCCTNSPWTSIDKKTVHNHRPNGFNDHEKQRQDRHHCHREATSTFGSLVLAEAAKGYLTEVSESDLRSLSHTGGLINIISTVMTREAGALVSTVCSHDLCQQGSSRHKRI